MTDKMSFIEQDSSFQDPKNILILKYLIFFNLKKWETCINRHYDWQASCSRAPKTQHRLVNAPQ